MNKYEIPVDNISNEILDRLKELYEGNDAFKVIDDRDNREYFMIRFEDKSNTSVLFTFIWIGNNLWQYKFINVHATTNGNWINPEKLLYKLVHNEYLKGVKEQETKE